MSECSYNCDENRASIEIPAYTDISGIGVIIGYTVTAGLAVLIITGYYFFAHRPELDPFRSDHDDTQDHVRYKPNPIDMMILGYTRKLKKGSRAPTVEPTKRRVSLEKALLKCVLTMSDMQILTGLSILISGYSQLRCGISVYHWQILVYLAWFCSLTHLSCLTVLRNHLYNHPGERLWRLIGMGALVTLLVVALLPTGNYGPNMEPADYAICSFRHLRPISWDHGQSDEPNLNYAAMVISIILMGLGFLSRIVRLHRNLSITIVAASRKYLSERARQLLRKLYKRCETLSKKKKNSHSRRLFVYRPALAVFLGFRAMSDLWSSMILEVWWLMASFSWGVYNLTLSLDSHQKKATSNKDWTFGQIAPIFLLLAPVLSVVEFILEKPPKDHGTPHQPASSTDESQTPSRTETMEIVASATSSPLDGVHDEPDHDFYQEVWFHSLIFFLLCGVIATTLLALFIPYLGWGTSKLSKGRPLLFLQPTSDFLSWFPIVFLWGTVIFVLLSLLLNNLAKTMRYVQTILWLINFVIFFIFSYFIQPAYIAGYLLLAVGYIVLSFVYKKRMAALA